MSQHTSIACDMEGAWWNTSKQERARIKPVEVSFDFLHVARDVYKFKKLGGNRCGARTSTLSRA